ncbi:MAG: DUF72 domain-containing protein [Sandaracinaceae bacterium]
MLVVACSGFPIAVSRYLAEFRAVEVSDSELGIPGGGTVRRWLREAPEGFVFTVLAPAEIGAAGFERTPEVDEGLAAVLALCAKLEAHVLVVRVPEDVSCSRTLLAHAKQLHDALPAGAPRLVIDAPGWTPAQRERTRTEVGVAVARDPLSEEEQDDGGLAYLTLPGPAGHRSRYDEETLAVVADAARASAAESVFVVFRNIDMEANAKGLMELLDAGQAL